MIENENLLNDTQSFLPGLDGELDSQLAPFVDSELADMFDRYASALDSGDADAAEDILAEYPEIGEEFRVPMRGLYLLGRAANENDLATNQSNSLKPTRLGDFELEHELGRGGMGVVYAATQISLQRRIALKVLPFTAVLDPRQVARFRNEAQAAASLHHPNIVPVYGVGCERGVHYYSMQLIEGQTLAEFIEQFRLTEKKENPAGPNVETAEDFSTLHSINTRNYVQKIVSMGAQVAEAIDFAHENGIIHRDIKPSNLLLDETGKIWVADFGLARGRGTSNLTAQGDQLGTLRYMSPEQAAGRNNMVDFRTDIYSLGVTLCELLTLRPAFEAADRTLLLVAIESGDPIALRSVNPSIPIDLETVLNKAVSHDPSERYSSAQEFADDLSRCLAGKPVQAQRKTVFDRMASYVSKNKRLVSGLAAALVLSTITASLLASVFYNSQQRERAAAENARFYLRQAHNSVDRFGVLLTDELAETPGTYEFRRKLLGESIGYYRDFLEFAQQTKGMELEHASAYSNLARLYERTGNTDKALSQYELSIDKLKALTTSPDAQTSTSGNTVADRARVEQAICFDRLGLLHKRLGDIRKSKQAFQDATTLFADLEPSLQFRSDALAAWSQTQANLANLNWMAGKPKIATEQYEAAIARLEPYLDQRPTDSVLHSAYCKVSGSYVSVLMNTDPQRAERSLRASIASLSSINKQLQQQLPMSNDGNPTAIAALSLNELLDENAAHVADMQNNLAVVLSHQAQFGEAETFAKLAIKHWKSISEQSSLDFNAAERLATSLNTLGEIQWQSDSPGMGDESFARAESIFRNVVKHLPYRPETLSRLAGVLHNRSLVAHRDRQPSAAKNAIERAIEFQSQALKLVPTNTRYVELLKTHREAHSIFSANVEAVARESVQEIDTDQASKIDLSAN